MSRCLSKTLIRYQNEEEAKILNIAKELDSPSKQILQELYEPMKITNEDLSREYTPTEVKQLCLRTKVRVNMNLFNCVLDAKQILEKKGRLENRSERFVNAMLVKAVQKKMVVPYTTEEIMESNHIRQCQLKKENNCRLDRWYKEALESLEALECSPINTSLMPAQIHGPDHVNTIGQTPTKAIDYPVSVSTQDLIIATPTSEPKLWTTDESKSVKEFEEEDIVTVQRESIGSHSEVDWAEAAAQINTESITIDLETQESESMPAPHMNTESITIDLPTQEFESIPSMPASEDYFIFDSQVPATSTQSQNTEPFL